MAGVCWFKSYLVFWLWGTFGGLWGSSSHFHGGVKGGMFGRVGRISFNVIAFLLLYRFFFLFSFLIFPLLFFSRVGCACLVLCAKLCVRLGMVMAPTACLLRLLGRPSGYCLGMGRWLIVSMLVGCCFVWLVMVKTLACLVIACCLLALLVSISLTTLLSTIWLVVVRRSLSSLLRSRSSCLIC